MSLVLQVHEVLDLNHVSLDPSIHANTQQTHLLVISVFTGERCVIEAWSRRGFTVWFGGEPEIRAQDVSAGFTTRRRKLSLEVIQSFREAGDL